VISKTLDFVSSRKSEKTSSSTKSEKIIAFETRPPPRKFAVMNFRRSWRIK